MKISVLIYLANLVIEFFNFSIICALKNNSQTELLHYHNYIASWVEPAVTDLIKFY